MAYLIILVNILIHVFLIFKGVSGLTPSSLDLILWGGNLPSLTLYGEEWRLLTSMFLHGGWLHLALNMYMLWQLGPIAEKELGRFPFLIIYFMTGLFASLTSSIWHESHLISSSASGLLSFFQSIPAVEPKININVSIGASGALMGLASACLIKSFYVSRVYRVNTGVSTNDVNLTQIEWTALAKVVVLNLALGFMISGVDNACHMGGAVSGLVIGSFFLKGNKYKLLKSSTILVLSLLLINTIISRLSFSTVITEASQSVRNELKKEIELKQAEIEIKKNQEQSDIERVNRPLAVSIEKSEGKRIMISGGAEDLFLNETQNKAYLVLNSINKIVRLNLESGDQEVIFKGQKLPLNEGCIDNLCAGQGAAGIAVTADETLAIVTSIEKDKVSFIDLKSKLVKKSISVGRFPRKIVLSKDQKWAFVFNSVDNSISVIDIENELLKETWQLDGTAEGHSFGRQLGLVVSNQKQQLFVLNSVRNQIEIFDIQKMKKINSVPILGEDVFLYDIALSNNDQVLWLLTNKEILKLNLASLEFEKKIQFCENLNGNFNFSVNESGNRMIFPELNDLKIRGVSVSSISTDRLFPVKGFTKMTQFLKNSDKLITLGSDGENEYVSILNWNLSLDVDEYIRQRGELFCFLNQ